MSGAKNRKLCWSCEGSVHIHATKCPFCATDLTGEPPKKVATASTPAAPYSKSKATAPPPPPYQRQPAPIGPSEYMGSNDAEKSTPEPVQRAHPTDDPGARAALIPMLLLLPGAFFLLFSTILLLFSSDGVLTLQWNARYWMLYLALALPLIYFGSVCLYKLERDRSKG